MTKPKMIIFDYGHTLLREPGFDHARGQQEMSKYFKVNKSNLTPQEISAFTDRLFKEMWSEKGRGLELHEHQFLQMLYEYLEIELTIPIAEAESILWTAIAPGSTMPNIEAVLEYLKQENIRSAVISNIVWSGAALTSRINRLLPDNNFEFIIASSEYIFRKPNPLLFELALKKAKLPASEVWFCGDNVIADIEGSSAVGMFPVWYQDLLFENPWLECPKDLVPNCDHLHIHDWLEFIEVLKTLS